MEDRRPAVNISVDAMGQGEFNINGVDIGNIVKRVFIHIAPGHQPRITVDIMGGKMELDAESVNARLGW